MMKYLLIIITITFMTQNIIFDFNKDSNIDNWFVVNDGVMGGRSKGEFGLSSDGYGVFKGQISLENNGGFSSVRYRFQKLEVNKKSTIKIRLKGDGKRYQFRIKHTAQNYYSYIIYMQTSGEWEDIEIAIKDMYPSFRGRRLDLPNFSHNAIEEITFLIGNKKAENFTLLIDKIVLN